MIKKIKLEVKTRDKGEKANKTRNEGFIPAVLYGAGKDALNLKIVKNDFIRQYALAGESTLIDLAIDGQAPVKALVKDVQKNVVRDTIAHVDFYRVDMKKKIEVEIPLNLIGEAKAVKELGGTLVKNMESIEVRCLPGDLIEKIDIDLSVLRTFDDYIRVKDVKLSSDFEVSNNPDDVIAHVMEPQAEEVFAAAPAAEGEAKEEKEEEKTEKTEEKKRGK